MASEYEEFEGLSPSPSFEFRRVRSASSKDRGFPLVAFVWSLLLGLVAVFATFLVWFRGIEVPHCGSRCDFELLYWSGMGYAIFSVAVVVSCIALVLVGWLRSSQTWWVPCAGAGALIFGLVVANMVASRALLY